MNVSLSTQAEEAFFKSGKATVTGNLLFSRSDINQQSLALVAHEDAVSPPLHTLLTLNATS